MNDADRIQIGQRLRGLREARGLSQRAVAVALEVTEATIRHWESGRTMPSRRRETLLADLLGVSSTNLFSAVEVPRIRTHDAMYDFGERLLSVLGATKSIVRSTRLSSPYTQPTYIQIEFRKTIHQRILARTIQVHSVEVVHTVDRLREVMHNLVAYRGYGYYWKYFLPPPRPYPIMNVLSFDDDVYFIGGHFLRLPPVGVSVLEFRGNPVGEYLQQYWNDVWFEAQPGTESEDLASVLAPIARSLGLHERETATLLNEATEIGRYPLPPRI